MQVPILNQLKYSAGNYTNAPNNCGWTCLAMDWQYLTGQLINPDYMHDKMLGDHTYGYAYVKNLGDWIEAQGERWHYRNGDPDNKYLDDVKAELRAGHPVIVLIVGNRTALTGGHFVLVTGWDGSKFYINNPWGGVRETMTPGELLRFARPNGKYWLVVDKVRPVVRTPTNAKETQVNWKRVTLKKGTAIRTAPRLGAHLMLTVQKEAEAWMADGAYFRGDEWHGENQWVFVKIYGVIGLTNKANVA